MLFKNTASQKIHVYAYDSTTGAAKTGDAANITGYVSLDGTANAIDDTNPTEVDATNMPGVYAFDLTQAETNCNAFALYAKSATANIRLEPIIGFTDGGRVDAAVTSRMASYTQPTGFLAATFPTTVASTTNITAGTITTVTNLTNAPTNGDLTATMKTSVTTAATAATPTAAAVTGNVGGNVTGSVGSVLGGINTSGGTITTLDALDAAQDTQHGTTQTAIGVVDTVVDGIAAVLAGITSLAQWLGLIAGKQTGNSTARTELRATGAGSGTFDETTDSIEALRDRGDAAWVTATGFSTHSATDVWASVTRTLTAIDEDSTTLDLDATIRAALGMAAASYDSDIAGLPTQAEITGGAYPLDTDANGRIRLVDGTGEGELSLTAGLIDGITGTLNTLDALDTAQDSQHATTQAAITALNDLSAAEIRTALGLASANLDTQLGDLPTAAENAAALLDLTDGIETGITPRQALRAIAAKAAGLISGAGTGTEVLKGIGQASGGTTRLTATVDASGNISAWTLNL